jgi:hypothetical protein
MGRSFRPGEGLRPAGPNQMWVEGITYLALPALFVYVAVIPMPDRAWSSATASDGRSMSGSR